MLNSVYITEIINEVKDGVDNSAMGPLWQVNPNNLSDKKLNTLAWSVFGSVLQAVLAQEIKGGDKVEK